MIIDTKTKHTIFSLPLIFGKILTKKELEDSEFVNMYTYDINSPLSSNHIFLVFHNIKHELLEKLRKHLNYHTEYTIVIDKIPYYVICFVRTFTISNIVNYIDRGLYLGLSYADKMKIISFWYNCGVNSNIHQYLFNPDIKTEKPIGENITIADNKKGVA